MADSGHEVPPIPVPPIEPAPRASRAKKPATDPAEAAVLPPLVDLAGGASQPAAQPNPYVQPAAQPNPYAQPAAQPNPYYQQNPYAQPAGYAQPNPYAQGQAPVYPGSPPAYSAQAQYYTGVEQPKTLSIVSMILGIAGVVFLGALGGIPAVITGHMAQKQQPYAKGFWLTGLITGYASIVFGLLGILIFIGFMVAAASDPYGSGYYGY